MIYSQLTRFIPSSSNSPIKKEATPLTPLHAELFSDIYGDQRQVPKEPEQSKGLFSLLFGSNPEPIRLPVNTGIPAQQFITMTNWNRRLDSFKYSIEAATKTKASAAAGHRQASFRSAVGHALEGLTRKESAQLEAIEHSFIQKGSALMEEMHSLQSSLVPLAFESQIEKEDNETSLLVDPIDNEICTRDEVGASDNASDSASDAVFNDSFHETSNTSNVRQPKSAEILSKLTGIQTELETLEFTFIKQVGRAIGQEQSERLQNALVGDVSVRGAGKLLADMKERPLAKLFTAHRKPKLFVTRFSGDLLASTVSHLRHEITAIVRGAKEGDEALVIVQSAGGTVTGYGLAAAELLRFKEAGLKLTVAVEQVAASGGYMATCVADTIICSDFAVVGSIGVVRSMPNIYERLQREGVGYQHIVSGKYKRTLSPTKKIVDEDLRKAQEETDEVWTLFKDFVAEHRPKLDIDAVTTGESWFGKQALALNLCDEIKTADDVILQYVDSGFEVFEVKYKEPAPKLGRWLIEEFATDSADTDSGKGLLSNAVRFLVHTFASELRAEFGGTFRLRDNKEEQYEYMAV